MEAMDENAYLREWMSMKEVQGMSRKSVEVFKEVSVLDGSVLGKLN